MVHHRRGDDVAHVLGVLPPLECHPDHLAGVVAERGSAGVPRIHRRVDLDAEEREARVGVLVHVHARDDARRHAQVVSTRRESHDDHTLLQLRDGAELKGLRPRPEVVILHGDERQVALVPHVDDLCGVLLRDAVALHQHPVLVRHVVRVGQDAPPLDDEPTPGPLALAAHLPGLREVRLRRPCEHLHHRREPRLQRGRGRPQHLLLLVQGRMRLALPHWQFSQVRRGRHRREGCPRLHVVWGSEGQGLLHVAARRVASWLWDTLTHGLIHRVSRIPRTPQRQPPGNMSRWRRAAPSALHQGLPSKPCMPEHDPPGCAPIPSPGVSAAVRDD
mmetsp:Transcript_42015/g.99728  ORF Transcript_42015/g.99728 Transcript_42015/m.99728 type:complete len:332 (-) Transcript_42015:69-1064(-)